MHVHARHFMRLALAAAAVASLAACATMDDDYATAGAVRAANDTEYMAAVEHLATRQGVKVVWVNPPETTRRDDE